jgi:hypothetical protein
VPWQVAIQLVLQVSVVFWLDSVQRALDATLKRVQQSKFLPQEWLHLELENH